jgi:hypothetical protein
MRNTYFKIVRTEDAILEDNITYEVRNIYGQSLVSAFTKKRAKEYVKEFLKELAQLERKTSNE